MGPRCDHPVHADLRQPQPGQEHRRPGGAGHRRGGGRHQSRGADRPVGGDRACKPTWLDADVGLADPLSTVVPRNATVCTPELARSSDTNCTVAQRVFSAVRTLGTDLPDSFRVTITDPGTDKNATFVCSIEAWIQCVGDDQAVVYVRRLV